MQAPFRYKYLLLPVPTYERERREAALHPGREKKDATYRYAGGHGVITITGRYRTDCIDRRKPIGGYEKVDT